MLGSGAVARANTVKRVSYSRGGECICKIHFAYWKCILQIQLQFVFSVCLLLFFSWKNLEDASLGSWWIYILHLA